MATVCNIAVRRVQQKPPTSADIVTVIDKNSKTHGDTPESSVEKCKKTVQSDFNHSLSDKLPPGYSDPVIAIDEVGCLRGLNVVFQSAFVGLELMRSTNL